MAGLVCGVDVGTGSARAGIFDRHGVLLGRSERPIALYREQGDRGEHAADEIWVAVGAAIRGALAASGATPADVAGLSFDATCSLVVRGSGGAPLALTEGPPPRDTIAWFDHRAIAEAEEFTATVHPVLDHLGGAMSPEMQLPKLMWLKRRRPDLWRRAAFLFDLADFLTWKATGSLARSQCTLVAKWTYLAHAGGWQRDLLARIGLDDLLQRGALPEGAVPAGTDLGPLTPSAASDLGLTTRCRVGAGLVDAFAGALGMLGPLGHRPGVAWPPEDSLALIGGTSSCLMSLSREPRRMPGGWGPYFGAVLPGTWMTEAGQTATGALLDHLLRWHAAGGEPEAALHGRVAARIAALRAEEGPDLAPRLHVLPDFLGNRAPLADPHAQGVISGLTLDVSFDSLCRLYFRSCVAIALGVRQILETLAGSANGPPSLHMTGGHTRNPLLMELYADATGCSLVEPVVDDAVLRGTAMAAAAAAGLHPDLLSAARAMGAATRLRRPDPAARPRLDRDYAVFLEMQRQRRRLAEF